MPRHSVPGLDWDTKRKTASFDFRSSDGKRHRIADVPCESHADACQKLKTLRAEREPKEEQKPETVTFGQYCAEHWDRSISAGWANSTKHRSNSAYDRLILPFFKDKTLVSIKKPVLSDFALDLKQEVKGVHKALAPPTINFCLRLVRIVLHHAREREIISHVPKFPFLAETPLALEASLAEEANFVDAFTNFTAYKAHLQASPHSGVTDEQARVYFAWFRASRPIFTVALETGLSLSDLLSLKWSSVDLGAGVITITRRKTRRLVYIPISTACRQAFAELKARTLRSPVWCFTQQDGSRFSEQTFRKHFATAKAISGLSGRRFRVHDLRHTTASKLVSEDVPLQLVQGVLGHASIATTMRYARPDMEAKKSIATALDRRRKKASQAVDSNDDDSVQLEPFGQDLDISK